MATRTIRSITHRLNGQGVVHLTGTAARYRIYVPRFLPGFTLQTTTGREIRERWHPTLASAVRAIARHERRAAARRTMIASLDARRALG